MKRAAFLKLAAAAALHGASRAVRAAEQPPPASSEEEAFAALRRRINGAAAPGPPLPPAPPLEAFSGFSGAGEGSVLVNPETKTFTLLPPGALLRVPEALRPHTVAPAPGEGAAEAHKYVSFTAFLAGARAWVRTEAFSLKELAGETAVPAARWNSLQNSKRVTVAVLEGTRSPVTARRLKPAPAASSPR